MPLLLSTGKLWNFFRNKRKRIMANSKHAFKRRFEEIGKVLHFLIYKIKI